MDALQLMVGNSLTLDMGRVAVVRVVKLLGKGGGGGEGGSSEVWQVTDDTTGAHYTLKIVTVADPNDALVERLRREAAVRVPSPHVVQALELKVWSAHTYVLLFEYFPADNLRDKLKRGLTDAYKKEIFLQILRGVAAAHSCNIIHRDLKPLNILIGNPAPGAELFVKLIDFGISKFQGSNLTIVGDVMGTLSYMAPEAWRDASSVDARADIYALGQIFYELVTGHNYWQRGGRLDKAALGAFLQQSPPRTGFDMRAFHCSFFPAAQQVLLGMIEPDYQLRYQTVAAVLAALDHPLNTAPAVPRLQTPMFLIASGSNRGARYVLKLADGETREIGRLELAGADQSISRRHLELRRQGETFLVRDLNSRNGSYVRGLRLTPQHWAALNHNDHIRIGDVFLRFVAGTNAEEQAPVLFD
jgi:eukaryotic-like serine/threonine-protein kinase